MDEKRIDKRCMRGIWTMAAIAGMAITVIINYEDICSMLGTVEYPIPLIWFVKIFGGFGLAGMATILVILLWRRW